MGRTAMFRQFARTLRTALLCEGEGISTAEGLERRARIEELARVTSATRREFLGVAGKAALVGAVASQVGVRRAFAAPRNNAGRVGIVGAGLGGLVCADRLRGAGIEASIFDAAGRTGGRTYSMGGAFPGPVNFPGQVIERGGELVDNLHKTMLGYVQQFGLTVEDIGKASGEAFYFFNGQRYPESVVVDEYRAFVGAMKQDLSKLSNGPTADASNDFDRQIDLLSLREYLVSRQCSPIAYKAIEQAYLAEYGLEIDRQASLGFLMFIHADKRSKFTPFGVFSDERYHIVEGNQSIAANLTNQMLNQITLNAALVRVAKTASGAIELTFKNGSRTTTEVFDHVVLAIPFSTLRDVEMASSVNLPPWKRLAIDTLGYGTNAKMMIGFDGPHWRSLGGSGASYSDLANHQTTWETNYTRATDKHAVLTDYSSGDRGARLDPSKPQAEAERFLTDLDRVFPGAKARASRDSKGKVLVHLEHWPSNPLTKGSYTCYLPGQFTTLAGNEGKPIGNLHFAGEHSDSFYDWQGFMEGACLSGLRAAGEILSS